MKWAQIKREGGGGETLPRALLWRVSTPLSHHKRGRGPQSCLVNTLIKARTPQQCSLDQIWGWPKYSVQFNRPSQWRICLVFEIPSSKVEPSIPSNLLDICNICLQNLYSEGSIRSPQVTVKFAFPIKLASKDQLIKRRESTINWEANHLAVSGRHISQLKIWQEFTNPKSISQISQGVTVLISCLERLPAPTSHQTQGEQVWVEDR